MMEEEEEEEEEEGMKIFSWISGVYAFGFLFMLPQLFLNYKVCM